MSMQKINNNVYYADESFVNVRHDEIDQLKELVENSSLKRNRLCVHKNTEDKIHEMFIVLLKGCYIMPAKHFNKSESLYVLEGNADAVFFNDNGNISNVIQLGDYSTGLQFFYRMEDPIYHTLIIRSEYFVFHEVTKGPLDRLDTRFAPWAPLDDNSPNVTHYMNELEKKVDKILINKKGPSQELINDE